MSWQYCLANVKFLGEVLAGEIADDLGNLAGQKLAEILADISLKILQGSAYNVI